MIYIYITAHLFKYNHKIYILEPPIFFCDFMGIIDIYQMHSL